MAQIAPRQRDCRVLAGLLRNPAAVRAATALIAVAPAIVQPLIRHFWNARQGRRFAGVVYNSVIDGTNAAHKFAAARGFLSHLKGVGMSVCILGIGTAVPERSIEQADAAEAAGLLCGLTDKQRRLLPTLYRHAGVRKRHTVLLSADAQDQPGGQNFYRSVEEGGPLGPSTAARMQKYAESATGLAANACRKALADAALDAAQITHLITVSCSGFAAPGVDVQLIRDLRLPPEVARTHVGFMGCHGTPTGSASPARSPTRKPSRFLTTGTAGGMRRLSGLRCESCDRFTRFPRSRSFTSHRETGWRS